MTFFRRRQRYDLARHHSQREKPLVVVNGNLNALRYRDEILRTHVVPFVQGQQRHITLQQDNTRPYTARVAMGLLAQQNVDVLPWPAVSPDLSPIEHVWDEMKEQITGITQSTGDVG